MANGNQKRTRQQRVAVVELPPGVWGTLAGQLRKGSVLLRLALCTLVAILLWGFTQGWAPPFSYRVGQIPQRDIVVQIDFQQPDSKLTEEKRDEARRLAISVYDQDVEPLVQLRAQLRLDLSKLLSAESFAEVDQELWQQFQPTPAEGTPDPTEEERQQQYQRFRDAFAEDGSLDIFDEQLSAVMTPLDQWGLLGELSEGVNLEKIFVRTGEEKGFAAEAQREVTEVLLESAAARLQQSLKEKLGSVELAQRIYARIRPRLEPTLTLNSEATHQAQDEAADAVETQYKPFRLGEETLAKAGEPLSAEVVELLRLEHEEIIAQQDLGARIRRTLAILGMYVALYTLCGFYISMREPKVLEELPRFVALLSLVILSVVLSCILNQYARGADLIPLLLLAMTSVIAYHQEMALLLSASVTLIVTISLGHDMSQALVLMATISGSVLVLKEVRTRGKLLSVGFIAAGVALLTTFGVGTLFGHPGAELWQNGFMLAVWSVIAGSLMTVLLPTVESVFGVQTDLSLIALGDPAHPLLQELIRRAPGTYNHSITVASLAEAAAESVGARGLLVRVGAYFHDIGKMLKPGYFIENQTPGDNRHDSLVPAMSTLVIIAHVKDGADLARQNKLPEPIIDFIQQHHGTTLVEYFYRQANEQKEKDPDSGEVDESSFRYPGPKPQTKEAGVLMLADAVESASRALKEPTPSRIESIVEDLAMKRLLDGQFDECGLTLEEVQKIGESLVKSLTAVYHGRVKYPGQETA